MTAPPSWRPVRVALFAAGAIGSWLLAWFGQTPDSWSGWSFMSVVAYFGALAALHLFPDHGFEARYRFQDWLAVVLAAAILLGIIVTNYRTLWP